MKWASLIIIILSLSACDASQTQTSSAIQQSTSAESCTGCSEPVVSTSPSPSPSPAGYAFSGGSGTPEDPYLVSTPQDFLNIATNLSASYSLINDINMKPTANGSVPIISPMGDAQHPFSGTFDGNGYMIDHLQVMAESGPVGLFASVSGKIQDLELLDMTLIGSGTFAPVTNSLSGSVRSLKVSARFLDLSRNLATSSLWKPIAYQYDTTQSSAPISYSIACINNGSTWGFNWDQYTNLTNVPSWYVSSLCSPLDAASGKY